MPVETIAVGNLTIAALYVDHFQVDIYSDAGYTTLIETQVSPAVSDGAGNWNQKDLISFKNLTSGVNYYLQAAAVSPGAAATFTRYTLVAGAVSTSSATYSGTYTSTPSGITYDIVPASVPTDINHFEAIWTKDGSVPSNTDITYFFRGLPLANGYLHIFASGTVGQTIHLYLRSVSTSGVRQNWVSVDSRSITAATVSGATYSDGTSIDALRPAQAGADVTASNSDLLIRNPNLVAGSVGWDLTSGFTIAAGGYVGSTFQLNSNASGTVSIINQQPTPCAPGTVLSAACYVAPTSGATGVACVRITYFNIGGAVVGYNDGNHIDSTTYGFWTSSRVSATVPAGTSFAKVCAVVYSNAVGSFAFGGFSASILANSLDEVPDGASYARPISSRINAGRPIIDFSETIHANQNLSYLADGGGRYAAVQAGADKTSSNTAADTTHVNGVASSSISPIAGLMPAQAGADVTGNNTAADTAKVNGVVSSTISSGAVRAVGAIDSGNVIVAGSIDLSRSYLNKTLDNINDGSTYARPISTRINAGRPVIDFSEAIHANQTIDHIPDGTTRFGAVQAGADKTSSNTAADTTHVNGVVASSISPIAGLMPAQAGADKTSSNIAAGFAGQGSLATLSTVNTAQIVSGAVNATISYSNSSISAPGSNTTTTLGSVTLSGTPLIVSIRANLQLSPGASGLFGQIRIWKGAVGSTAIYTSSLFTMNSYPNWSAPVSIEAIDASPAANQLYTASLYIQGGAGTTIVAFYLVADSRKA